MLIVSAVPPVIIIRYKVNSAEQGNSHQHIYANLGLTPTLTLI